MSGREWETPAENDALKNPSGDAAAVDSRMPGVIDDADAQDIRPVEDGADNIIVLPSPVAELEPLRNQNNYRITDADKLGVGSLKQKCRNNLAAIELLIQVEMEKRAASQEEKSLLVRYVGWGGLPQVFDTANEQWSNAKAASCANATPIPKCKSTAT